MVNFKDLRKPKIRKKVGQYLEVYNIQAQDKEKLLNILQKYKDVPDTQLVGLFVMKEVLPYLSNIEFGEDLDDEEIMDIFNNADVELQIVVEEVDKVVGEFIKETTDFMQKYKDKTEALDKMKAEWEKEKKEVKKRELAKQLKELE